MDAHWQRTLAAFHFLIGWPAGAETPDDYAPVLPYMVLPGLLIGLLSILVLGLCHATMSNLSAMLFATVLLALLWGLVSRGQNLLAAGALGQAVIGSMDENEPLSDDLLVRQVTVFALILLKLACLAILAYRGAWMWIFLVPLGASFYALEMAVRSGYFSFDSKAFTRAHNIAIAIFLLASLVAGMRGLVVVALIWLLCVVAAQAAARHLPGRHPELINGGTEVIEVLVLLLGVIFLT